MMTIRTVKSTTTTLSGKYYEGGYKYYHTAGCYEKQGADNTTSNDSFIDGIDQIQTRYYRYYYANLGDNCEEISRDEYERQVARITALKDTIDPKYSCKMELTITTVNDKEVYN